MLMLYCRVGPSQKEVALWSYRAVCCWKTGHVQNRQNAITEQVRNFAQENCIFIAFLNQIKKLNNFKVCQNISSFPLNVKKPLNTHNLNECEIVLPIFDKS